MTYSDCFVNFVLVTILSCVTFSLHFAVTVENANEKERGDTKDHPLAQWFMNFSEADELLKLAAARQQVRIHLFLERNNFSLSLLQ